MYRPFATSGKACLLSFLTFLTGLTTTVEAQNHKYIQAVDEYRPAPGQFVNTMPPYIEGDDAKTMAAKCTDSLALGKSRLVSLGGYGGFIVFHFDHPIANIAGRPDFAVWGNAFELNAEPAIILVSVDANGNNEPDDEWYEIKGSEWDRSVKDYEITYVYDPMKDVAWTDNQGGSGVIPRNEYHSQEYFPQWLTSGKLSFRGTLLPKNAELNGKLWELPAYEYGYADNFPNIDRIGCSIDIGWAIDKAGQPVELDHIDYVKCYTGVNQVCGPIGETSSEISGAEDLHLDASLEATAIRQLSTPSTHCGRYTLNGQKADSHRRGLVIERNTDGTVRKRIIQ